MTSLLLSFLCFVAKIIRSPAGGNKLHGLRYRRGSVRSENGNITGIYVADTCRDAPCRAALSGSFHAPEAPLIVAQLPSSWEEEEEVSVKKNGGVK